MRMLILMLLLHLVEAKFKQRFTTNGDNKRVVVDSINKAYLKYFRISAVYYNRSSFNYKIEFNLLKTIDLTDTLWLDISFYHSRNNQFHFVPIGRGIQVKKFLEDNPVGIGDSIKKVFPIPVPPGKRTVFIPPPYDKDNYAIMQVPMSGDFKVIIGVKEGSEQILGVAWMVGIRDKVNNKKL